MTTTEAPAPARFTEYSSATVGRGSHHVRAERDGDHWVLTLIFVPVQPQLPPDGIELAGAEFIAFICAQSTHVAVRRVPRQYVGDTEVMPAVQAGELARQILGTAWTVDFKGRGWKVELALR